MLRDWRYEISRIEGSRGTLASARCSKFKTKSSVIDPMLPSGECRIVVSQAFRKVGRMNQSAGAAWNLLQVLRLVFVLICLGCVGYDVSNGVSSNSWPETDGKLLNAQVKDVLTKMGSRKEASIKYSYSVNGHRFTADRIMFGGPGNNPESTIQHYKNSKLTVHYNPEQPEISCLVTGFNQTTVAAQVAVAFIVGLLFFTRDGASNTYRSL